MDNLYQLFSTCTGLVTDSRHAKGGEMFIALRNMKTDGNQYAHNAIEHGCKYAVIDNPAYYDENDERYILVEDAYKELIDLAKIHRSKFDIPFIGITGTCGKTTTKELVAAVLKQKYNVLYTYSNNNDELGVALSLLRLTKEHELAVLEIGASEKNGIAPLVEFIKPQYGIITNVGKAHLQGFGSFENVVKTKGFLYDYLKNTPDSVIFYHEDDEMLCKMIEERQITNTFSYSTKNNQHSMVCGNILSNKKFVEFEWYRNDSPDTKYDVKTHWVGSYNLPNLMAAISVGVYFDIDPTEICEALEGYIPTNNRSQLQQTDKNTLIIDAYNANPKSMKAALDNFSEFECQSGYKKMLILGDMAELGEISFEEHKRIVDYLIESDVKNVWLVGEMFSRVESPYRSFQNVDEVKELLLSEKINQFTILIKGSNSTRLYELPDYL